MELGDPLPKVTLRAADGTSVSTERFRGRALLLFVYPRADTPGCTQEARDFDALASEFEKMGVSVAGVSKDAPDKLQRFAEKHSFAIPLLSDAESSLIEGLGAWGERSLYGRRYMGTERSTFLFDADLLLRAEWRNVRVKGHADAVLTAMKAGVLA